MTEALYITVDSADWSDAIEGRLRAAAENRTGRARRVRLITRAEGERVSLEPFFGSASFAALLSVRRQLDAVRDAVSAIVHEAFFCSDGVGVLLQSDRKERQAEVVEESVDLETAVAKLDEAKNTWFRIRPPARTYAVSQVEGKLYRPLRLDSGDVATHYFRNYRVRAEDVAAVQRVIVEDLARDGVAFLGWQAAEVEEVSGQHGDSPTILDRGGRVYFCE